MKRRSIVLLAGLLAAASLSLAGCFRLDSFFYYDPTKVSAYKLGSYPNPELADVNQWMPDNTANFNYQLVSFAASDGNTLYGYLLKHSPSTGLGTILYCHGDAYNLDQYWPRAKLLYSTGADVLIFDYEGYGRSGGSPTEDHLHEDAIAAMDYLTSASGANVPINQIFLYGYSLGSVPAVWIAAKYPNASSIKGLTLEAPVGSAALFVQNASDLPLPPDTVTNLVIDNAELVKTVTIPYFWLQGDHDSTIRYDTQGQAVYDNYGGNTKYKVIVAGGDHTNLPTVLQSHYGGTHYSVYLNLVTQFLQGQPPVP